MTTRKRNSVVVLALIGAIAMASAAFAYWTGGGTGTGTAPTKAGASPITAVQTTVLTPMFPGDTAQTISGTFNNTNDESVYVATVTVAITNVTKATGAPAGTCDASDYTLAGTSMTVNADVPKGANPTPGFTGATIKFNNKTVNQNACKGATVTLGYTIA